MISRVIFTPHPSDVPPAEAFAAASRINHSAAEMAYRAASLNNRLIEPTSWAGRILAATTLHNLAKDAAFETGQMLRLLQGLAEAEAAALRAADEMARTSAATDPQSGDAP